MARRFQYRTGIYYRFNVDQGLQYVGPNDWEKMSEVVMHSRQYMKLFEVDLKLGRAAKHLVIAQDPVPTTQLSGVIPPSEAVKTLQGCPLPSSTFVGQEDALGHMERCFWDGIEERHIFVLYGLGGGGKTQLALKFAQIHRAKFSEELYIDASSANTIETDLAKLAASKKPGKHYIIAIRRLASQQERWLLILNNADDTSLDLKRYFPQCSHGDVLITTRNRQLINYARGPDAYRQLSKMGLEDGKELLFKKSRMVQDELNDKTAEEIVTELGFLALAIAQAGAYIGVHECSLESYLDMYRVYRGELLEQYKYLTPSPDDYECTVFTTWQVSLDKLSQQATKLLCLLASMHHDQILEETFRRASIRASQNKRMDLTDEYSSAEGDVISFLSNFKSSDGGWYLPEFHRVVTEIRSYSLIDSSPGRGAYSIHPLVHSWIHSTIGKSQEDRHTTILLALSIDEELETYDHEYLIKHLPHIDALSKSYISDPTLARKFAVVYNEAGRYQDAKCLREAVVETDKRVLGLRHKRIITDMFELANAYHRNGELQQAEKLHTAVLEGRIRTLGDTDLDTHRARGYLASTYRRQGRFKEALELNLQVSNVAKSALGPEARETLLCQHSLASTYNSQGLFHDAESILIKLIETQKRVLGPTDHDTLSTMELLADVLQSTRNRDKLKDAEDLIARALNARKQVSGDDHYRALSCHAVLARIHFRKGQFNSAIKIQEDIVAIQSRTLGESHHRTLSVRKDLALTYQSLGQLAEAEKAHRELIDAGSQVLDREHPDVLLCIVNLAKVRFSLGKRAEAELMILEELASRSRISINRDNLALAMLKITLAHLYVKQQRWKEVRALVQTLTDTQMTIDDRAYCYAKYDLQTLAEVEVSIRREHFIRWIYYFAGFFVAFLSIAFMHTRTHAP